MTVQEWKQMESIVGKKLEDKLTVVQMRDVLEALRTAADEMDAMAMENQGQKSDDLMEAFIQAKRIEGRSEKTIEHYEYVIRKMLDGVKTPIGNITVYHLRKYMAAELERGLSENTIRGYQDVFNSLFGWLWREGLIQKNPCANIGTVKIPKIQRMPFSAAEIETIKENCKTQRDKAIICFMLASGCRIEEATKLNIKDVDMKNRECKVYGKGKKERTVYIDEVAATMLSRYLQTRKDDNEALFIGRRGERLTPSGVRAMMKKIEKSSGVANIHPHRFRRTLATNLASKGMSIQEVAKILGHEEINTTMKYVSIKETAVKHHYQTIVA